MSHVQSKQLAVKHSGTLIVAARTYFLIGRDQNKLNFIGISRYTYIQRLYIADRVCTHLYINVRYI